MACFKNKTFSEFLGVFNKTLTSFWTSFSRRLPGRPGAIPSSTLRASAYTSLHAAEPRSPGHPSAKSREPLIDLQFFHRRRISQAASRDSTQSLPGAQTPTAWRSAPNIVQLQDGTVSPCLLEPGTCSAPSLSLVQAGAVSDDRSDMTLVARVVSRSPGRYQDPF